MVRLGVILIIIQKGFVLSRLKVCGIKSAKEAQSVLKFSEISYIGIIFADSIRQVSLDIALEISRIVHDKNRLLVGVFVDENMDNMIKISNIVGLDVIQLHVKNNSQSMYHDLKNRLNAIGKQLWLVLSVSDTLPVGKIQSDIILYDTKGKMAGGNGVSFDWSLLLGDLKNWGMAGGIGEHNIIKALSLRPDIIDINSKIEDQNGIKDENKLAGLISKFKGTR